MIIAVVAVVIIVLNFLCLRKPSTRILSGLAEHISEKRLEEEKAMHEAKAQEQKTDGDKASNRQEK